MTGTAQPIFLLQKAALMPANPGEPERLLQPGQRVVYTGTTPPSYMKPHNDAAKALWNAAYPAVQHKIVTVPKASPNANAPFAKPAPKVAQK